MGRLVDTDDLEKALHDLMKRNGIKSFYSTAFDAIDFETLIDEAPTVDAEPVRHERWIDAHRKLEACKCTACGAVYEAESNFCPNCGAKMDAEESNAE